MSTINMTLDEAKQFSANFEVEAAKQFAIYSEAQAAARNAGYSNADLNLAFGKAHMKYWNFMGSIFSVQSFIAKHEPA